MSFPWSEIANVTYKRLKFIVTSVDKTSEVSHSAVFCIFSAHLSSSLLAHAFSVSPPVRIYTGVFFFDCSHTPDYVDQAKLAHIVTDCPNI